MSHLIRDEPDWTYRSPLNGELVQRRLRVWRTSWGPAGSGHLVAVVTEQGEGTSITNAAEVVVRALEAEHPFDHVVVIEHYPANVGADVEEHYDEIAVSNGTPRWRRRDARELAALLPGLGCDQCRAFPMRDRCACGPVHAAEE